MANLLGLIRFAMPSIHGEMLLAYPTSCSIHLILIWQVYFGFDSDMGKGNLLHTFLPILSTRLGSGIIISWIGSCAISSAVGIHICAINISAGYALRINGELIVPDRIILVFRDLVSS